MKKIIIFDVDGTLLDTTEFILQAFEFVLETQNLSRSRDEIRAQIGKPLVECYKALAPEILYVESLASMHREFQIKNMQLSKPFVGAKEVLQKLKDSGFTLAACTTRSKITSLDTLENAGLKIYFEVIISSEDTKNSKPDPEPLLVALEKVGGVAENAIMIGDSWVDIQAGKNAGTKTIRCLYGVNQERLHVPEPDAFVSSVEEIPDSVQKLTL